MRRLKELLRRLRGSPSVGLDDLSVKELFRRVEVATHSLEELQVRSAENDLQRAHTKRDNQAQIDSDYAYHLKQTRDELAELTAEVKRRRRPGDPSPIRKNRRVRTWRARLGGSSSTVDEQAEMFEREELPTSPWRIADPRHGDGGDFGQTFEWTSHDAHLTDGLPVEQRQQLAAEAASTINHTLARLLVQLGPPPEGAGGGLNPVSSGGGGAQQ
ncbi:hypothetical protein ACIP2X_19030 [Streptomyces sp. NPDC089424]|uniref:hypothetical protein n=1 Tax=Streptomyces sp. NPDC089424 TaxID=3365917 RepID=UPI003809DD54